MEAVKHGYEENRRILVEGLPKAGLDKFLPVDGAFYLYADVSRFSNDSLDFAKRMLEEAGVAATPGIDFDPVNGQQFPALLLRRLGGRHARGGRADRRLAQALDRLVEPALKPPDQRLQLLFAVMHRVRERMRFVFVFVRDASA